jgi:vitamin B12 transporter
MDIIKSSYPLSNCTKGILNIDNCALKLVLTVLFPAILLTCLSVQGVAQTSDTLQAVDIRVKTADNNGLLDIGNKKIEIDSIYRQAYSTLSLDRLLQDQSNIFVRSYGVNNMATFSIRGTSAAQNILLWQGIPINSPSMGMADISLINNVLFHNIAIEYGSNSLQYGSGNMGGNIQLSNGAPKFEKQINNTLIGSLGSYQYWQPV